MPDHRTCDNSGIRPVGGPPRAECLNPTPIPAASDADPIFAVRAQGGTTATYTPTLAWDDKVSGVAHSARLHGVWFIDRVSAPTLSPVTLQFLRIHYGDWDGKGRSAWLLQVRGVGAVVAARLLGELGCTPRVHSAAALAALAGIAPLAVASGGRQGHRVNPGGNRKRNRAIHIVALTQRRCEPLAQAY